MKKGLKIVIFILITSFGFSCTKSGSDATDSEKPSNKNTENADATNTSTASLSSGLESCSKGTLLSYQNFGKAFFTQHCVQCHETGKNKIVLEKHDDLYLWAALIKSSVILENSMPPGYQVNTSEKELLLEWMSCGMP